MIKHCVLAGLITACIAAFSSRIVWALDCQIAKTSFQSASSIRHLKPKHEVPCKIHNKDEIKDYLLTTINTKIPPQRLRMEEIAYKAIGFIPMDFDYQRGLVDLYLSQLGGYYDPEKKHYIMAGWIPDVMQTTIAVHELTHALQDQYYDLEPFMDVEKFTSDELLARSSLVEGDATAVMLDYTRGLVGQGPIADDPQVDSFIIQNMIGVSMSAGPAQVPQSLQLMLVFPYSSGLRFAHAILQKGSYAAVDKVFAKPPRSTEEILHPEKYFEAEASFQNPRIEEVAELAGSSKEKVLFEDTLGEFAITALLGQFIVDKKKVADASAGWGGDKVAIFDGEAGKKLVWRTHWDTEKDAKEFWDLYLESLPKAFPKSELSGEGAKREVNTSAGNIQAEISGMDVKLVMALKDAPATATQSNASK